LPTRTRPKNTLEGPIVDKNTTYARTTAARIALVGYHSCKKIKIHCSEYCPLPTRTRPKNTLEGPIVNKNTTYATTTLTVGDYSNHSPVTPILATWCNWLFVKAGGPCNLL
jgi:hypothetical protein